MEPAPFFRFRLFVAGDTVNSAQALRNLTNLCIAHLPERHHIEVVDVFIEPLRALAEGILMTPAMVKLSPQPVRKIVGTLSNEQILLHALEIEDMVP
ncbi:MAG: putative thiol disulfide isomerase [Polaromonas sp.]|nr:putative thiol disulfide isomerase [Polaromonas sp.]